MTEQELREVRQCPFCGSRPEVRFAPVYHLHFNKRERMTHGDIWVKCLHCGLDEINIHIWNRRACIDEVDHA